MTDPLYYTYYDTLYSGKDYYLEVKTILELYKEIAGGLPGRVLDVGCGTGTHALIFAENSCEVVGIDIDCGAIDLARKKSGDHLELPPTFFCQDVKQLDAYNFDLAASLFNVVNYIDRIEDLLGFFQAIHKRLNDDGMYIFDCWNGLAAILDVPREKNTHLIVDDEQVDIATRPQIDLMNQRVCMDNTINITSSNGTMRYFSFSYQHRLWMPWVLSNLLEISGFQILKMSKAWQLDAAANHDTWKIMFICRKES